MDETPDLVGKSRLIGMFRFNTGSTKSSLHFIIYLSNAQRFLDRFEKNASFRKLSTQVAVELCWQ